MMYIMVLNLYSILISTSLLYISIAKLKPHKETVYLQFIFVIIDIYLHLVLPFLYIYKYMNVIKLLEQTVSSRLFC